jgi:hypothetical protein
MSDKKIADFLLLQILLLRRLVWGVSLPGRGLSCPGFVLSMLVMSGCLKNYEKMRALHFPVLLGPLSKNIPIKNIIWKGFQQDIIFQSVEIYEKLPFSAHQDLTPTSL